ncbi:hypothetical protein MUN82_02085 [Hymenobacter aerilatus]|uniref:DUF4136 domain-containing protein n=1 Tax=Hymenobacter aerilatus TaxID=2932251 RepID=A0A8T9T088_9BACT|nr:hypothetical protein [Hymenobacter aerilatus]UOR05900.1 hypothetical protein MUN82_02085 [Hymenobacter aerilatus]
MKAFVPALLLIFCLPACQQTAEEQAQAQVQEAVRTHFTHSEDYKPGEFRSRPYTRYDSLTYQARMAVLNATMLSPDTVLALTLPPRRPADTVRIGTLIAHTYNTSGGHGLARQDSATYVMYRSGTLHEVVPTGLVQARLRKLGR